MSDGRFVILLHEVGRNLSRTNQNHYDWMFETDDGLLTWAVDQRLVEDSGWNVVRAPQKPNSRAKLEFPAEQLPLHRLAYLDYEGAVSRDRGFVTRCVAGTYSMVEPKILHPRTPSTTNRITADLSTNEWSMRCVIHRIRTGDASSGASMAWRLGVSAE